jgi:hypothetical protein
MINVDDTLDEEIEDTLTQEEQQKITSIQLASLVKPSKNVEYKPFSLWNVFDIFKNVPPIVESLQPHTLQDAPLNIIRLVGIYKVVTINNISGKDAYIILTTDKITNVKALGIGGGAVGVDCNFNIEFENKGECKPQKISITNNTRSEFELETSKFHCTLFFNIDGEWKKSWDNRRFNGKIFDINILEKHVTSALKKENIPDF